VLALCAPMLGGSGALARPASYAEIARRLGRQPQYVRNIVKPLRESLA
jgi:DNA-binding IscR family transcriptional regulator